MKNWQEIDANVTLVQSPNNSVNFVLGPFSLLPIKIKSLETKKVELETGVNMLAFVASCPALLLVKKCLPLKGVMGINLDPICWLRSSFGSLAC